MRQFQTIDMDRIGHGVKGYDNPFISAKQLRAGMSQKAVKDDRVLIFSYSPSNETYSVRLNGKEICNERRQEKALHVFTRKVGQFQMDVHEPSKSAERNQFESSISSELEKVNKQISWHEDVLIALRNKRKELERLK